MKALGINGKPKTNRTAGQSTSNPRDVAQETTSARQGTKKAKRAEPILESSDCEESDGALTSDELSQSPLEKRKKQIVDNVMVIVMQWLNATFPPKKTCDGGSFRSHGVSGSGGKKGRVNDGNGGDKENEPPQRSKKRQQRDESPDGNGDGDGNRKGGGNKRTKKYSDEGQRKWACPFYQHDPSKHKGRACRFPGFVSIHRLKEHIYRCHLNKLGCPRCAKKFDSDKALDAHLRADEVCKKEDIISHDGINGEQEMRIRARPKKDNRTDEQRWVDIYKVIFPDTPEDSIPSPYCDEEQSRSLDGMHDYIRRGLPGVMRRQLEVEIEEATSNTEREVKAKMLELLPRLTCRLIEMYRRQESQPDDQTLSPVPSGPVAANDVPLAPTVPMAADGGTVYGSELPWSDDSTLELLNFPISFDTNYGGGVSFG